jgi:hypothetical protein
MKHITRTLVFILVLTTLLVSACAGAAAPASNSGGGKAQSEVVEFTGVIDAINGNQWTINGQVVTVDPALIKDGPFQVGDTVKLEAQVAQDGSVTVTRVETPSAPDSANGNESLADNSNSNVNDNANANTNDSSGIVPPPAGGGSGTVVFDDGGSEAFGSVDSITADSVVVGGQTFTLTNGSEFKDQIQAGDFVKVHFALNADGTYSIVEIESWDPASVSNGNSNSNDDNSNGSGSGISGNGNSNGNDDHGNGSDDNSNGNGDDHGGNDDDGNGNGGDDHSGNGNG